MRHCYTKSPETTESLAELQEQTQLLLKHNPFWKFLTMKTVVFCGVLLVGWFCLIFFSVFLLILQCKSKISHLLLWGISKVTFHYTREEKVADQSPSLPNVICQRKRPETHCPKGVSPMTRVSPTRPWFLEFPPSPTSATRRAKSSPYWTLGDI